MSGKIVSPQLELIVCPGCGYECSSSNARCPKCGKEFGIVKKICPKCKSEQRSNAKFCGECGADLSKVQVTEEEKKVLKDMYCEKCKLKKRAYEGDVCETCGGKLVEALVYKASYGTLLDKEEFDAALFNDSEDSYIFKTINEEIKKNDKGGSHTLPSIERRKTIMTIIYSVITFLLIMFYVAYHVAFALSVFLFICLTIGHLLIISRYNIRSYLVKEVKARPDEKISNIVASVFSASSNSKMIFTTIRIVMILFVFCLSLGLFSKPHYIYEKQSNGYVLRYYTLGLLKTEKEITIPSKYKGDTVVGMRGDVFKNVKGLEKVILPDTMTEIRGGAFKRCSDLKEIKLPKKLEEIHGETFLGCHSLEHIEIPTSVKRVGGGAFRYCSSLKVVTLPDIDEIHGETFEECDSLEQIIIPDSVTRIGGHAFYGCDSLREVKFTENSQLKEIGSSAFRMCGNLDEITIPWGVIVNERAFKESPTIVNHFNENIADSTNGYSNHESFNFYQDSEYGVVTSSGTRNVKLTYMNLYSEGYTLEVSDGDRTYKRYVSIGSVSYLKEIEGILLVYEGKSDSGNYIKLTIYYN